MVSVRLTKMASPMTVLIQALPKFAYQFVMLRVLQPHPVAEQQEITGTPVIMETSGSVPRALMVRCLIEGIVTPGQLLDLW